jgi:hypothetical protein
MISLFNVMTRARDALAGQQQAHHQAQYDLFPPPHWPQA